MSTARALVAVVALPLVGGCPPPFDTLPFPTPTGDGCTIDEAALTDDAVAIELAPSSAVGGRAIAVGAGGELFVHMDDGSMVHVDAAGVASPYSDPCSVQGDHLVRGTDGRLIVGGQGGVCVVTPQRIVRVTPPQLAADFFGAVAALNDDASRIFIVERDGPDFVVNVADVAADGTLGSTVESGRITVPTGPGGDAPLVYVREVPAAGVTADGAPHRSGRAWLATETGDVYVLEDGTRPRRIAQMEAQPPRGLLFAFGVPGPALSGTPVAFIASDAGGRLLLAQDTVEHIEGSSPPPVPRVAVAPVDRGPAFLSPGDRALDVAAGPAGQIVAVGVSGFAHIQASAASTPAPVGVTARITDIRSVVTTPGNLFALSNTGALGAWSAPFDSLDNGLGPTASADTGLFDDPVAFALDDTTIIAGGSSAVALVRGADTSASTVTSAQLESSNIVRALFRGAGPGEAFALQDDGALSRVTSNGALDVAQVATVTVDASAVGPSLAAVGDPATPGSYFVAGTVGGVATLFSCVTSPVPSCPSSQPLDPAVAGAGYAELAISHATTLVLLTSVGVFLDDIGLTTAPRAVTSADPTFAPNSFFEGRHGSVVDVFDCTFVTGLGSPVRRLDSAAATLSAAGPGENLLLVEGVADGASLLAFGPGSAPLVAAVDAPSCTLAPARALGPVRPQLDLRAVVVVDGAAYAADNAGFLWKMPARCQ